MIEKVYSKTGRSCRVTFQLLPEIDTETAYLVGEFNDWDTTSHPMRRSKDGSFKLTLSLKPGHKYGFRYLLDGNRWMNDGLADAYQPNPFGGEDSIVQV
jgi:1,4-alpha-glucan branching enzyme